MTQQVPVSHNPLPSAVLALAREPRPVVGWADRGPSGAGRQGFSTPAMRSSRGVSGDGRRPSAWPRTAATSVREDRSRRPYPASPNRDHPVVAIGLAGKGAIAMPGSQARQGTSVCSARHASLIRVSQRGIGAFKEPRPPRSEPAGAVRGDAPASSDRRRSGGGT